MKETIEHNNRFYTNEKGEIKTENEQLKEWLIIANKENERLNGIINKIKSIIYNSIEYNALTKVALIRESLQGVDKE